MEEEFNRQEAMRKRGEIDSLLDGEISEKIDDDIQRLQEVKDNLNKKIEEFALHESKGVKNVKEKIE